MNNIMFKGGTVDRNSGGVERHSQGAPYISDSNLAYANALMRLLELECTFADHALTRMLTDKEFEDVTLKVTELLKI